MFINILGPDGCGKTTQIEKLERWIGEELNLPVRRLEKRSIYQRKRYPECEFLGVSYENLAHRLLPSMYGESRAMWLFYMLAVSVRHYPPRENEVVLADGYWQKHYATEAAMGLDGGWLEQTCAFFPEPDLTLVLDMDPREVVARGHEHKPYESGCDFSCSDAAFVTHQDKVRRHILALASRRGYEVLAANAPVESLFARLRERLAPSLSGVRAPAA